MMERVGEVFWWQRRWSDGGGVDSTKLRVSAREATTVKG